MPSRQPRRRDLLALGAAFTLGSAVTFPAAAQSPGSQAPLRIVNSSALR